MKIVEATIKDIEILIKLNKEVQDLHIELAPAKYKKIKDEEISEWLNEVLNNDDIKILIGVIDSEPVGYSIARIVRREENAFKYAHNYIEVDQIAIKEAFRNKGYGKRFIGEIKQYAKTLGMHSVTLFVVAKNVSAVKAYEAMGFESEGIKMALDLNT